VELSLRIRALGYRIVTVPAARAYHKASATMRENSPRKNYPPCGTASRSS
jgi:GT2 family glycosyltransferase